MTNLGFTSPDSAVPDFRIQLTGTQFELYVAHNAETKIEAKSFIEIKYTVYVPKYVECDKLNWSSLNNVNGDNTVMTNYVFPNLTATSITIGSSATSDGETYVRIANKTSYERVDVVTGSLLKIAVRLFNYTEEDVNDLNLISYFKGNMQTRRGCGQFAIMGDIKISASAPYDNNTYDAMDDPLWV
jgi:hypothetical protein